MSQQASKVGLRIIYSLVLTAFFTLVCGSPPSASELQYIDKARIDDARQRKQVALANEPLIAGFDVSGGGKAWNVIRFRRGLDGDPEGMPPIRIPGEKDPDRSQRLGICAELLRDRRPERHIAALFIDAAFGAAIAVGLKNLGFTNVSVANSCLCRDWRVKESTTMTTPPIRFQGRADVGLRRFLRCFAGETGVTSMQIVIVPELR